MESIGETSTNCFTVNSFPMSTPQTIGAAVDRSALEAHLPDITAARVSQLNEAAEMKPLETHRSNPTTEWPNQ
jgi:hypothetical protein